MFQLPPTTATPPNFGGGYTAQQQPVQQPPVQQAPWPGQSLQSTQAVQPLQQGSQQPNPQPAPPQQYPNLATAMQQMPNPGFNYQNGGLQTRIGPQLRGMPGVVKPPPLLGPDPNNALSQGTRMPSLVR